METRISPELGPVQRTLLLPLIGRAEFSRRKSHHFLDRKAEEIAGRIDFDQRKARRTMGEAGMLAMAVRAEKMDRAIRAFTDRHPHATIVNLGAGLDTAFWRVDNGRIRWIDLDLPDSIDLRKRFLPASDRNTMLARSMFDYSWIDELGDTSGGLFIQVPGVLPYIDKGTVMDFFAEVPPRLPGAEIMFDVISRLSSRFVNFSVRLSGMKGTSMDWGISDALEMKKWSPHIEVVSQQGYFDGIPRTWRLRPGTNILMNLNDWWKVAQLIHLRFT
jgi:O-methyltransferase involved in polyketide biosynthesis